MTMAWLAPVREEFRKRLHGDRLAHAFLLSGQTGTGKQGLAMEMAAALLCLENSLPACGSCRSCQLLMSGAHPDFRILSFELNNKGKLRTEIVIDQVRELAPPGQAVFVEASALLLGVARISAAGTGRDARPAHVLAPGPLGPQALTGHYAGLAAHALAQIDHRG